MKLGALLLGLGSFMLFTTLKKPASKEDTAGLNFNGIFFGGFLIVVGLYLIFRDI